MNHNALSAEERPVFKQMAKTLRKLNNKASAQAISTALFEHFHAGEAAAPPPTGFLSRDAIVARVKGAPQPYRTGALLAAALVIVFAACLLVDAKTGAFWSAALLIVGPPFCYAILPLLMEPSAAAAARKAGTAWGPFWVAATVVVVAAFSQFLG